MGALGTLERLLDALARRLPPSASAWAAAVALRAAADGLPEGKAKTKALILSREEKLVEDLLAKVQENVLADEAAEEERRKREEEEAVAQAQAAEEAAEDSASRAAYANVDAQDANACISRCADLLRKASASLRRERRAEVAVAGLVAVLPFEASPDSGAPLSVDSLQSLCLLVAPAISCFLPSRPACQESRGWCRFLGFLLAAPARLAALGDTAQEAKADELATRLGGLVALATSNTPLCARAALRFGLLSLAPLASEGASPLCTRLSSSIAPAVRLGFGAGALREASLCRGDLMVVFLGLRVVGLRAGAIAASGAPPLSVAQAETRAILISALEHSFDTSDMCTELAGLAEKVPKQRGAILRKRLLTGDALSGREGRARIIAELLEVAPRKILSRAALLRLADCAGLPVDKDESVDELASKAKATGDLFFEDVTGDAVADGEADDEDNDSADEVDDTVPSAALAGLRAAAVRAAAEATSRKALDTLEGVEALRRGAARNFQVVLALEQASATRLKKKRKRTQRAKRPAKQEVPATSGKKKRKRPEGERRSAKQEAGGVVAERPKKQAKSAKLRPKA